MSALQETFEDHQTSTTSSISRGSYVSLETEDGAALEGNPPDPTSQTLEAETLDDLDFNIATLPEAYPAAFPSQSPLLNASVDAPRLETTSPNRSASLNPAANVKVHRPSDGPPANDGDAKSGPSLPRTPQTTSRDDLIFPSDITNAQLAAGVMWNPNRGI
ncbi:hypothetical protein B0H14DRAFT_2781672 [Mycena olivaceomarginata]|nr:hypothetical protein B0H14DRAFT_2781672 [Mycena olivaceomarginata]